MSKHAHNAKQPSPVDHGSEEQRGSHSGDSPISESPEELSRRQFLQQAAVSGIAVVGSSSGPVAAEAHAPEAESTVPVSLQINGEKHDGRFLWFLS